MKKYFCYIAEVNGECEYSSNFLAKMDEGKEDEQFKLILLNYRDEGEFADDSEQFVWYSSCLGANDWSYRKIPEEDFEVLTKYLAVLSGSDFVEES